MSVLVESAPSLASSVYARLREDVLRGVLPPGSKLRVEALTARYGAGGSPVREALNRLAAERLIEHRDQRGFYARSATREDLEELARTRAWLEERALRESMAHRNAEWEERLILAHHRLQRTPRRDAEGGANSVEWETRHRDFHAALIANCRSHWLMEFCARLSDHAYLYRQLSRLFGDATRNEAAEHETIMQHALSGDTEAAVAALMWHYQMTFDLCRKAINAGESGGYPPTPPSAPSPPHRQ